MAELVGLTPGTVSAVLNNSSASHSVPKHTKKRILAAARALDYPPNFFARSLRVKRTNIIGVILEEIGDAYGSLVVSGIERYLREQNVFFLTVAHRHDKALLASYSTVLRERGVEGFLTVDTLLTEEPALPTVSVAGHRKIKGGHERCSRSPPGGSPRAYTSARSGSRTNRIHEGFEIKR